MMKPSIGRTTTAPIRGANRSALLQSWVLVLTIVRLATFTAWAQARAPAVTNSIHSANPSDFATKADLAQISNAIYRSHVAFSDLATMVASNGAVAQTSSVTRSDLAQLTNVLAENRANVLTNLAGIRNSVANPEPPGWLGRSLMIGIGACVLLLALVLLSSTVRRVVEFAWKQQKGVVCLALIAMACAFALLYFGASGTKSFWDYFQIIPGIATLVVALFVWYGEQHEDWEEQLPKRLDVYFVFQHPILQKWLTVMVCEGAYLAGESDIRQWGQQIGGQMSGRDFQLSFRPDIFQELGTVAKASEQDEDYSKQYRVVFFLNKFPALKTTDGKPAVQYDEETWMEEPFEVFWTRPGPYNALEKKRTSRTLTIESGRIVIQALLAPVVQQRSEAQSSDPRSSAPAGQGGLAHPGDSKSN